MVVTKRVQMFPSFNPGSADPAAANCSTAGHTTARTATVGGKERRKEILRRFFDGLEPFTKVWGILTAIVLAGVGVDLAFHRHQTGYYLIGEAAFILVAEVTWVVTLFLQICVRNDSRLWKCWSAVRWFSCWKKSVVYAPLSAVPVLLPHQLWLSYLAAGQLATLAVLHLMLTFKTTGSGRRKRRRKDRLLHHDTDSFESSKFEEVTEVLDDGLPDPIPGSSYSICDSLASMTALQPEPDGLLEI